MKENPRKTRRFQFSLRTVFVVTTLAAVLVAVAVPVGRYVIREREERVYYSQIKLKLLSPDTAPPP